MAVLVTGGAGYVGSHVVLKLLDMGESVVVVDQLIAGAKSRLPPNAELIVEDFGNRALIDAVFAQRVIDAVIHVAASADAAGSVLAPLAVYENNLVKTHALVDAMAAAGIPYMVFTSTAAIYRETSGAAVDESADANPTTPYGRSKLAVEWLLSDLERSSRLRSVSLRCFNIAGAETDDSAVRSSGGAVHLFRAAAQVAVGARPAFEIFGGDYPTPDGTCIRDFVHVADVAEAHVAALRYLRAGGAGGVVNCGTGSGYSVLDIIKVFERVTGLPLPARFVARRVGDPAALIADVTRAASILHWGAKLSDIDTMVRQTLDWERRLVGSDAGPPRCHAQ